ncbi:ATP synthase subunit epsilon, mitochondrial [Hondaea fermentalgiana]|uniref:ATP synthase subunit epsilon, mitochondrial n=1 Tax=Hondaea fermentalgiana TaxID=2315210 RepID=A0A2R5GKF8_9STRA|nr:ATP synthase subunit epsilon, mitochondrial [Hondaea fermentalgiana]|eukprot:GBG30799.1 ATP synthase subunit epsilon, mitochondrial [Hondaea fermentalgiana]
MSGISTWRVAGLTYTQYVQVASKALRNCVKEDAKKKMKTFDLSMKERVFINGEPGEKVDIVDPFAKSIFSKSA